MVWDLVGGRGFEPPLPRCERVKCDGQEKGTSVGSIPIARSLGKGYESYILVLGGGDFLRLDFVLEVVRVETVEKAKTRTTRFLRNHQGKGNRVLFPVPSCLRLRRIKDAGNLPWQKTSRA